MSCVEITNVQVFNNPAKFVDPFQFEITFECIHPLEDDLDWSLQYVACPSNAAQDITLESVSVGPVYVGINKFILQADAPDVKLIPRDDLLGVTVLIIKCEYRNQEFVRVGYYVSNEYESEELRLNPPDPPQPNRIIRNILADKPRVTKFNIDWTAPSKPNQTLPLFPLPYTVSASSTPSTSISLSSFSSPTAAFTTQTFVSPSFSSSQTTLSSGIDHSHREVLNTNSSSEHSNSNLMENMPLTLSHNRLVEVNPNNTMTSESETTSALRSHSLIKSFSSSQQPQHQHQHQQQQQQQQQQQIQQIQPSSMISSPNSINQSL